MIRDGLAALAYATPALGQSRRSGPIKPWSGLFLIADIECQSGLVAMGQKQP